MSTAYRFSSPRDNYSPTREWFSGTLTHYASDDLANHSTGERYVISDTVNAPDDLHSGVFVIDHGAYVVPCYVAGWNDTNPEYAGQTYLSTYPLSVGTRPDGRAVDMSQWALGPRKSYHLKVI